MEAIKPTPILNFNENQLQTVRKNLGYEDVNKLKQDITLFKDWIKMQAHFRIKEFDDDYLERLLICNKGSIERTKQKFDKLCTCVNLMPEFLLNIDMKNEFQPLLKVVNICVLPKPTSDYYRILITQATGLEDSKYKLMDYYRYHNVLGCYSLTRDYCHGYEMILDARKTTMGLISSFNPVTANKGLTLLVEAMGHRLKKLHLISDSKFLDTLVVILKQMMPGKLKQRLVTHTSVEGLHEHFAKELLPIDLGGTEKSIKDISDMNFKEFSSDEHIAKMKFFEGASTDESLRTVGKFNEEYSGMPGSFKTLCVD